MDTTDSDISSSESKGSWWSPEEHQSFLRAYEAHGKNWRRVAEAVGTRTITQVRSHAQKYFLKLKRHALKAKAAQRPALLLPADSPVPTDERTLAYQNYVMRSYIQTIVTVNMAFAAEMERTMQGDRVSEDFRKSLEMIAQTPFLYGLEYPEALYRAR